MALACHGNNKWKKEGWNRTFCQLTDDGSSTLIIFWLSSSYLILCLRLLRLRLLRLRLLRLRLLHQLAMTGL
jgi:hypothetical protein